MVSLQEQETVKEQWNDRKIQSLSYQKKLRRNNLISSPFSLHPASYFSVPYTVWNCYEAQSTRDSVKWILQKKGSGKENWLFITFKQWLNKMFSNRWHWIRWWSWLRVLAEHSLVIKELILLSLFFSFPPFYSHRVHKLRIVTIQHYDFWLIS